MAYSSISAAAASICLLVGYWHSGNNIIENDKTINNIATYSIVDSAKTGKDSGSKIKSSPNLVFTAHRKLRLVNQIKNEFVSKREEIVFMPIHSFNTIHVIDIFFKEPAMAIYKEPKIRIKSNLRKEEYSDLRQLAIKYIEKKWNNPLLADIIEGKRHYNIWDYATTGINKLAEATGTEFKIERSEKQALKP